MGAIVASYLVRVQLRRCDDQPDRTPEPVTNENLERILSQAIYDQVSYFHADDISVSSERIDK